VHLAIAIAALTLIASLKVLQHAQTIAIPNTLIYTSQSNNTTGAPWGRDDDARQQESLSGWRQALVSSNQRVANAVVIGDSIACCVGPQDYGNVWTNSLRTYINLHYRQHGTGIIPVGSNDKLALNPLNPQWSLHDNTGQTSAVNFGPYQTGVGAFGGVFKLTGDAELTLLVPERHPYNLVLYYASSTDSGAGILVSAGKKPLGTFGKESSPRFLAHTAVIPLKQISSKISFSPVSASGSVYIYGAEFIYDDEGVSIHNIAHGFARSEAWGADTAAQLAFLDKIPGGIQLAVISLGVNDSIDGTGTTASEYRSNMQKIIYYLRQLNPDVSIFIYDQISTRPGEAATLLPQSLIREQEKQLARTNHAAYFSPLSCWGDFSVASARGYFSPDGIHPTDLGDRELASLLEAMLFEEDDAALAMSR
jgi:lysophospholipase L1-like esterase